MLCIVVAIDMMTRCSYHLCLVFRGCRGLLKVCDYFFVYLNRQRDKLVSHTGAWSWLQADHGKSMAALDGNDTVLALSDVCCSIYLSLCDRLLWYALG